MEFSIVQLGVVKSEYAADISRIMGQHVDGFKDVSLSELSALLTKPGTNILVAVTNDDHIIGLVTLISNDKLGKRRQTWIEDLVVDEQYRGQGVGEALTKEVLVLAKEIGATAVCLTSRPSRTAANNLYQKLGFQIVETNYYKLDI